MRRLLLSFALVLTAMLAQAQTAPTIITEQPQGTLKTYSRGGTYVYWYLTYPNDQDGKLAQMVWADDGVTVYLQAPVCGYTTAAWIKGTVSADGTMLSFPAGQYIEWDDEEQYGLQVCYIKNITSSAWGSPDEYEVDLETPITYTVSGNTITLNGTNDKNMLGLIYDDTEEWVDDYNAEYGTVLTLFEAQPVAIPAGLSTTDYALVYGGTKQSQGISIVKVAFDGTDVYIQGISGFMTEACVRGTLADGIITIEGPQFAGIHNGVPEYWIPATSVWTTGTWSSGYDYTFADKIQLAYDAEAKAMKPISAGDGTADISLILNGGTTRLYYLDVFDEPALSPFEEKAATPADPVITSYDEFEEGDNDNGHYRWDGTIYFRHQYYDVDGNVIDPAKVTYQFFTDDDQPYTLKAELYRDLSEDWTEVPSVISIYDIYGYAYGSHTLYLKEGGYNRIGVQAIYRGGGEERRSKIVYTDDTTSDGPMDVSTIGATPASSQFFDLQGRRLQSAGRGQLVIRRTTGTDGTVRTKKILSR